MFIPQQGKSKGTRPAVMPLWGTQRHNPACILGFVGFYLLNLPFQPFPKPRGCLSRTAQGLCAPALGRPMRMLRWTVPSTCTHRLAGRLLLSVNTIFILHAGSREQPAVKINERGTMLLMSRNSAPARTSCSSPATLSCLPAQLCSRSDFIPVIAPVQCCPSHGCLPVCPSFPPACQGFHRFTAQHQRRGSVLAQPKS